MRTENEEIRDHLKYLSLLARDYPSQALMKCSVPLGSLSSACVLMISLAAAACEG